MMRRPARGVRLLGPRTPESAGAPTFDDRTHCESRDIRPRWPRGARMAWLGKAYRRRGPAAAGGWGSSLMDVYVLRSTRAPIRSRPRAALPQTWLEDTTGSSLKARPDRTASYSLELNPLCFERSIESWAWGLIGETANPSRTRRPCTYYIPSAPPLARFCFVFSSLASLID